MVRIILAAIAGFIAWSILWVGSEQVLSSASPDWLGAHQTAFERATFNNEPFAPDSSILVLALVRLIIVSIISGFLTAVIAGENRRSTLILGILLLLFGGYVTFVTWSLLPIWYHLLLLVLLIPMTVLGGKLKKTG
jgi:hypothetical protein